jgi:hypothetical protein
MKNIMLNIQGFFSSSRSGKMHRNRVKVIIYVWRNFVLLSAECVLSFI